MIIEINTPNCNKKFTARVILLKKRESIDVVYYITCGNMADVHSIIYADILERLENTPFEIIFIVKSN